MGNTGHLFSLNTEPYTYIIAVREDLDTHRFPPPFDSSDWSYIGMIELTNEKLWRYAYNPKDVLMALATRGYYWVPPQVYMDILAER